MLTKFCSETDLMANIVLYTYPVSLVACSTSPCKLPQWYLQLLPKKKEVNAGYKSCIYIDTEGHPTVGTGFNLDRSDTRRRLSAVGANYDKIRAGSATLTDYQIRTLFNDDMANAVSCASSWLFQVWGRMSTDQKSVVADIMAFIFGLLWPAKV